MSEASVRKLLEEHAAGERSTSEVMRKLNLDWKGDLIRVLNANRIQPPLGDAPPSPGAVEFASALIAEAITERGRG
jgi:hypothetical protein